MKLVNLCLRSKFWLKSLAPWKQRHAKIIKLFRYSNQQLGIAFFTGNNIEGEAWIENFKISQEYEHIFLESGLELGVKYPIEIFGLSSISISK